MKKGLAFAGLASLALIGAGWTISGWIPVHARAAAAAAPARVVIDNFTFSAPTLTISPGTGVTWVNRDDVPHTVTSEDRTFKSPVLDTNDTFTRTFDKPGTYSYYCSIHPRMEGKVVVR